MAKGPLKKVNQSPALHLPRLRWPGTAAPCFSHLSSALSPQPLYSSSLRGSFSSTHQAPSSPNTHLSVCPISLVIASRTCHHLHSQSLVIYSSHRLLSGVKTVMICVSCAWPFTPHLEWHLAMSRLPAPPTECRHRERIAGVDAHVPTGSSGACIPPATPVPLCSSGSGCTGFPELPGGLGPLVDTSHGRQQRQRWTDSCGIQRLVLCGFERVDNSPPITEFLLCALDVHHLPSAFNCPVGRIAISHDNK